MLYNQLLCSIMLASEKLNYLCISSPLHPLFPVLLHPLPCSTSSSLTAHWRYIASARTTRLSTSVSQRTAPAPHRPVHASRCSGLTACPVCLSTCRLRRSHPPPSRCPGGSPSRTLRTSSVMCSTSAGPQVRTHWWFRCYAYSLLTCSQWIETDSIRCMDFMSHKMGWGEVEARHWKFKYAADVKSEIRNFLHI